MRTLLRFAGAADIAGEVPQWPQKSFVRLPVLCLSVLLSLVIVQPVLGKQRNDDAAAAAGCLGCGGFLFLLVALFVLNIALLVWVARDAKARGMDSSVLWMILVMFTGPIGLAIYLFSRPQGNVVNCQHCSNKRLQASAKCPHCGNA
jgi:hypothetical protein